MKLFPLASDRVKLEVTEIGGMLGGVRFDVGGRWVAPMHTAPWVEEAGTEGGGGREAGTEGRGDGEARTAGQGDTEAKTEGRGDREASANSGSGVDTDPGATGDAGMNDLPPMLQVLRGDFLAAPFGESDVIEGETRSHGLTANGRWRERGGAGVQPADAGPVRLELELDGTVMGARVRKTVELRPGQPVVYQRDTFEGGRGRIPMGHHAMLRARSELRLSFAPWRWAATPPERVEVAPNGRSALRYPQRIEALERAAADGPGFPVGATLDLTRYPLAEGYEDLWMLASRDGLELAWTAAVCAAEGWVWFALKDPRVLPCTLMWLSNGGRDYVPWSGRHRGVIGLEEICSYFHLGHRASVNDNELSRLGVPTALELTPERPLAVPYIFGLAPVPATFGQVHEVHAGEDTVTLVGDGGAEVRVACDPSFLHEET